MLKVENLTKKFNDIVAVDDISFRLSEGKMFGLLGPNGAGKTTTIRTVLNIIKPTSGTVRFKDKVINEEFFNVIGYLPEERGLYKKSKAWDVIMYFASLKNMSHHFANEAANHWITKLDLGALKSKRIEELSKGNQQKIQFICAVIHDPELLILDEPFSGFDPINQQIIKDVLLSFSNSGKLIILSTHQMETAEKLCSEILLINKGKEVCSGSISEIKRKFASNNIKIEFEGDGTFIKNLPFVKSFDSYNNYAEIQLTDSFAPSEFLKTVIDKIEVKQFSTVEPTLNKIFIDVIKEDSDKK